MRSIICNLKFFFTLFLKNFQFSKINCYFLMSEYHNSNQYVIFFCIILKMTVSGAFGWPKTNVVHINTQLSFLDILFKMTICYYFGFLNKIFLHISCHFRIIHNWYPKTISVYIYLLFYIQMKLLIFVCISCHFFQINWQLFCLLCFKWLMGPIYKFLFVIFI